MNTEQKEKMRRERDDVEWVLSTEQGRRFLWRLLGFTGVYRDMEGDADAVFKQVGRRQVGLFLLGIITDASEDHYNLMSREARSRALEEKIKYDNANNNGNENRFIDDIIGDYITESDEYGGGFPSI